MKNKGLVLSSIILFFLGIVLTHDKESPLLGLIFFFLPALISLFGTYELINDVKKYIKNKFFLHFNKPLLNVIFSSILKIFIIQLFYGILTQHFDTVTIIGFPFFILINCLICLFLFWSILKDVLGYLYNKLSRYNI